MQKKSKEVVDQCMLLLFGRLSLVIVVNQRKVKFLANHVKSCNNVCMLFAHVAQNELDALQSSSMAT